MLKFEIAPEKLNDFFSYIKKEKNKPKEDK